MKIGLLGLTVVGFAAVAAADATSNRTSSAVAPMSSGLCCSECDADAAKPKLEGLFGVKLGAVLPTEACRVTNDEGIVVAAFSPKKTFFAFTDYLRFVSPESRRVVQIQASRAVLPNEAQAVMDTAVRLIEFRFDQKAVAKDATSKAVFFADKDFILVSYRKDRIVVEACCDKLLSRAHEECERIRMRADKVRYAKDLETLKLVLVVESSCAEGRPTGVVSVLGRKFGEAFAESDKAVSLPDGSWSVELGEVGSFVGCRKFFAFGSTRTKGVFRVRGVWSDTCDKRVYEDIRRVVEIAMKHPMTQSGENSCRLDLGNVLITLVRDAACNRIALDFSDKTVYARHLEEARGFPAGEVWQEIEAL